MTVGLTGEAHDWVWLARLRRSQGRKGEVYAEILTDFPEKFAERRHLFLIPENPSPHSPTHPRQVTLVHHWLHKGGVVLHFEGVNSISEAEQLAGLVVAIPIEDRAPLAEDEIYIGDLIGCTLFDLAQGKPLAIGEIESVDRSAGPVPLLVIRRSGTSRGEILIPFAKSYLRKLDLAGKRVEMELPTGLVGLNLAEEA